MKNCWNQIGVWSWQSQKCGKLSEVIHCRNCEVYTSAGRQALERRVPKEYSDQWLQNYASIQPPTRKKYTSIVVFRLGVEWFGLPTLNFKSVENISFIHSIPRYTNGLLLGIVNIRGTLQLCFSITSLVQVDGDTQNSAAVNVYKRLVVLLNCGQHYVLPVDEVGGIERVDESCLEALPATLNEQHAELVKGVIKTSRQRVALLNTTSLFAALEAAIGG